MDLVHQNHPDITIFAIRAYGCAMRCAQAIAEIEAKRALTANEIMMLYHDGIGKNLIGKNKCWVRNNPGVINQTAKYLGYTDKLFCNLNDKKTEKQLASLGFEAHYIRYKHKTNTEFPHFTLKNIQTGVEFDPYDYTQGNLELKGKFDAVRAIAVNKKIMDFYTEGTDFSSTSIDAYGYKLKSNVLIVIFKSKNRMYLYSNVPPKVFNALVIAPSKGDFINKIIKPSYSCN